MDPAVSEGGHNRRYIPVFIVISYIWPKPVFSIDEVA